MCSATSPNRPRPTSGAGTPNYAPPGWTPTTLAANSDRASTLTEALRTPHWYLLWTILAINVTAGAALISVAAPLVQELAHVSPALGALAVCLISLFNGIGRQQFFDRAGRLDVRRIFLRRAQRI